MILRFRIPVKKECQLEVGETAADHINMWYNDRDVLAKAVRVFRLDDTVDYQLVIETQNNNAQFIATLAYDLGLIMYQVQTQDEYYF